MPKMRAKMVVQRVEPSGDGERLRMNAVGPYEYREDGLDENNTYARWTPFADLTMDIKNPSLVGQTKQGDMFYVDFIPVEG